MLADIHVLDKFEILPYKQSKSVSSFGNRNEYSNLSCFCSKDIRQFIDVRNPQVQTSMPKPHIYSCSVK